MLNSVEAAAQIGLTKEKNPTLIHPRDFFQTQEEVREVFAELINASEESIILCPSVSYGMASVFNNITAKEGGNAVTVEGEFPYKWRCHEELAVHDVYRGTRVADDRQCAQFG